MGSELGHYPVLGAERSKARPLSPALVWGAVLLQWLWLFPHRRLPRASHLKKLIPKLLGLA
jgi:hypothetical protein